MDWHEIDALADELRRTLARGSIRSQARLPDHTNHALTPKQTALITLADIDHLRYLDRARAIDPMALDRRRADLATDVRRLLE